MVEWIGKTVRKVNEPVRMKKKGIYGYVIVVAACSEI